MADALRTFTEGVTHEASFSAGSPFGGSLYAATGGSLDDASGSSLAQATSSAHPPSLHAAPPGLFRFSSGWKRKDTDRTVLEWMEVQGHGQDCVVGAAGVTWLRGQPVCSNWKQSSTGFHQRRSPLSACWSLWLYEATGGSLDDATGSSLAQASTNADPPSLHAGPSGLFRFLSGWKRRTRTGLCSRSCRCYMVKGGSLYEATGGLFYDASGSSPAQATSSADPPSLHAALPGLFRFSSGWKRNDTDRTA
eukprot:gene11445-34153_t